MSPSDEITDEDIANSPFHGKATARIAQETGDPLADVDVETAKLKALARAFLPFVVVGAMCRFSRSCSAVMPEFAAAARAKIRRMTAYMGAI